MENLKKEIENVIRLHATYKFYEGETLCKKLIERNPKVAFLYNLLGLLLAAQKKYDDAIKIYEKGVEIEPDYAMIYNNLGTVYKAKNNNFEAEKFYKKSITLNDKIPESYNNLGNLLIDINKYGEAIECFKKSIDINPKFFVAHYNLGILYKNLGDFLNSKKYLQNSISLYPKIYNAHRALSQIHKYNSRDDHLMMMEKLYKEKDINEPGKTALAFALGKANDDIKNYKNAFNYYFEGNKLRRKKIDFSLKKTKKEFSNIKKVFSKSFIKKYINLNNEIKSPIFIVGMPRSGTTLVEQIISSHSKVFGCGEINFFNDLIKENFYKNDIFALNHKEDLIKNKLDNIANQYIEKTKILSLNHEKFTDKLPINFKWIGFIKLIFPQSKIIHCSRNSKDTCLSIYKNFFTNEELNYAYDISDLVNFYNYYKDLINFWNKIIPNSIYDIKYENLIKNPNKEIPKLINACDLNQENACIEFYSNKRPVKTASDYQVRSKIYKTSINMWKNYNKFLNKNLKKLKS